MAPNRCTWICAAKVAALISCTRPGYMSPAPDTNRSISPSASILSATKDFTESASVTSSGNATASPPSERIFSTSSVNLSTRRAPSATGKPLPASSIAVAAPMPDEAPAMMDGRRAGCGSNRGISVPLSTALSWADGRIRGHYWNAHARNFFRRSRSR
ncbi:Uncharacterised protein [Mycobacteroides abscessus subsp. abscessus]|nr:Uncharacterised protein [Mycobacteroides abscessus subsp. abscessus]